MHLFLVFFAAIVPVHNSPFHFIATRAPALHFPDNSFSRFGGDVMPFTAPFIVPEYSYFFVSFPFPSLHSSLLAVFSM